ncbi:MAG: hypothetical protein ACR2FY_05780 [Pirellulaceae bacterium]
MDAQERNLIAEMQRGPRSEDAKIRYEQFLADSCPDSVELQLLRRQRELANSYSDQFQFDQLVDDYVAFMTEHSYYFWDRRGGLDYLQRSFKVWLVSCHNSRRFALNLALKMVLDITLDLDKVPAVIVEKTDPISSREVKENIIGFVRRYRGPTGREPELQKDEVILAVTPWWVTNFA